MDSNTPTYEEELILRFWSEGKNISQIARILGISKSRVNLVFTLNQICSVNLIQHDVKNNTSALIPSELNPQNSRTHIAYAYLLGLYLGDGDISRNRNVYRLRITLDLKYPNIIADCKKSIETILPNNKVGIVKAVGCVNVSCHHKFWPDLFPQHGDGRKHNREIKLEEWQFKIIDSYPLEFFRGLFHSDGSRDKNVVKGKEYPRYAFTNLSQDIRQLFCHVCDLLGLHWTVASNGRNINIAKRADVEYLDGVVGPKS